MAEHIPVTCELSPPDTLTAVCASIEQGRTSGAIRVLCLHHPLFLRRRGTPRMLGMEVLRLKNRTVVARELARAGVHVALAGHVHCQQHTHQSGLLQFIAGSACQIAARPGFWMLDLYATTLRYTWLHVPKGRIHFEPAISRSGATPYPS